MSLTSFEALYAFAGQLERNIRPSQWKTKIVVLPSPVKEKGTVIKLGILKSFIQTEPPRIHASRMIRVRVSVAGSAESRTGLEQALGVIEALDGYLVSPGLRLEAPVPGGEGAFKPLANSRIIQSLSQEDSFFDSPDSTEVQEIQDDRIVTITIPQGA